MDPAATRPSNRRRFLREAAALVGAGLASRLDAADSPSPPRIPIGFLGTSYSHAADKLRLTLASPDWELVGAAESNPRGLATCRELGVPILPRDELLRRCRVVAVESDVHDNNVAVLEFERAHAVISNTAVQSPAIPARSFEVIGTRGSALLQPLEPPRLVLELAEPAGPYPTGRQEIPLPPYRRYIDEFAELAAAVRGERPLSVDLEGELLTADTVLRASGL